MRIILASSSPRRKELLSLMGVEFETQKPQKDEDMTLHMSATKLSKMLSRQKAQEIFDQTSGDRIVIGSDCMVFANGKKLGKPKNREEAYSMLSGLSNKWHKVITGLCVLVEQGGKFRQYITCSVTKVKFKKLSSSAIESYLDTGEYKDKAGSYAVQGKSGMFIEKIIGNMSTVIGLPTHLLYDILKKENILK